MKVRFPPKPKKPKERPFRQTVAVRREKEVYPYTPVRCCAACKKLHKDTKKKYCMQCHPNIGMYRARASFKFNVYAFPDEFDLPLIAKHGWYSPTGKHGKNTETLNLHGVSRDHMYTVSEGFKNGVDPALLAHPANCRLMLHADNNTKNSACSLSLDDLKRRIEQWNSRYGG